MSWNKKFAVREFKAFYGDYFYSYFTVGQIENEFRMFKFPWLISDYYWKQHTVFFKTTHVPLILYILHISLSLHYWYIYF